MATFDEDEFDNSGISWGDNPYDLLRQMEAEAQIPGMGPNWNKDWYKRHAELKRAHARSLGIDPDSVSDAILELMRTKTKSPLGYLLEVVCDEQASKTQRGMAAQAALPYVHGRPKEVKKDAPGATPSVMEVPMAQSMEEWESIAGPSQQNLKAAVRQ